MNKRTKELLIRVVFCLWTIVCIVGFLIAFFATSDTLAGAVLIIWCVPIFIFTSN